MWRPRVAAQITTASYSSSKTLPSQKIDIRRLPDANKKQPTSAVCPPPVIFETAEAQLYHPYVYIEM